MKDESKVTRLTPSEMKSIQMAQSEKSEYKYSHFFMCGNGMIMECQTNCNGNWAALSLGPVINGYVTHIRCNEFIHSCNLGESIRFAGVEYLCNPDTWPGNSDDNGSGGSGSGDSGGSGSGDSGGSGSGDSGSEGSGTDGKNNASLSDDIKQL